MEQADSLRFRNGIVPGPGAFKEAHFAKKDKTSVKLGEPAHEKHLRVGDYVRVKSSAQMDTFFFGIVKEINNKDKMISISYHAGWSWVEWNSDESQGGEGLVLLLLYNKEDKTLIKILGDEQYEYDLDYIQNDINDEEIEKQVHEEIRHNERCIESASARRGNLGLIVNYGWWAEDFLNKSNKDEEEKNFERLLIEQREKGIWPSPSSSPPSPPSTIPFYKSHPIKTGLAVAGAGGLLLDQLANQGRGLDYITDTAKDLFGGRRRKRTKRRKSIKRRRSTKRRRRRSTKRSK